MGEAKESSLVIPSVAEDAAPAADGAGQETEAPAAQAQTDFASAVLPKETDFLELPQPVRYEELQKECLMSLRPETFEGMRFHFTRASRSPILFRWAARRCRPRTRSRSSRSLSR